MRRESGTGYHPGTGPTYIETVRSSAWRSRGLLLLTAALLAAVLGLNTSAAQTPCPLTDLGALDEFPSVDGRLERADCSDPFDVRDYADRYEFRLTREARVTIDLTSRDFNAYLRLLDAAGNQIERDNNGGDGRHSRITRTLSAGRYQLVATEASRGTASGAYALRLGIGVCSAAAIPEPPPGAVSPGLVLLTHGWRVENPTRQAWLDRVAAAMRVHPGWQVGWQVVAYHWERDAASGPANPFTARSRGIEHGRCLARAIEAHGYDRLHLIGHSAGAILIDELGEELQRRGVAERLTIQATFLDAYTGWPWRGELGGKWADYAEHYVNRDDWPGTGSDSEAHVYTIDLTALGNKYHPGPIEGHDWPRIYYICTVFPTRARVCPDQGVADWLTAVGVFPGWPRSIALGNDLQMLRRNAPIGGAEELRP